MLSGKQPVVKGGASAADMQVSGGRGGESYAYCVHKKTLSLEIWNQIFAENTNLNKIAVGKQTEL